MKIAVTSQNRRSITGHAGKCRRFWLYQVDNAEVSDRQWLELPLDQTLHAAHGGPHPLDDINVLITGGLGQGLQERLKQKGILAVATPETEPDRAVSAWLNDTLAVSPPGEHGHTHTPLQTLLHTLPHTHLHSH